VSDPHVADVAVLPSPMPPAACASCGSSALSVFYEQDSVPAHSCRLVETREEALAFPSGTLRLAFCSTCGFIMNTAYDPTLQDYGIAYEETQGFSQHFRDFARSLALRWIERYDLRDRDVLEIGCGKGEFLALLCELGPNRGTGIDPAFVDERLESTATARMTFLRELYGERHASVPAHAIVCRHTLEHIAPVAQFLGLIRRTIRDRKDCVVLFDLPDVVRVLRETAFWDVYYEHCSYFSPGSLARLFRRSGFEVLALERDYDNQYIVLEARAGDGRRARRLPLEESVPELAADVELFRDTFASTTRRWRERIALARADGRRIAIWGAGSKGVAFLRALGGDDKITHAIDINPYKAGKYLPGTAHVVVGPEALPSAPPDLVIAMNAVYVGEIRERLGALGLGEAEVVSV
jgi:hypothetical protein